MAYARPSLQEDVIHLAPHLREEDVAELRAASGHTPEEALQVGFMCSSLCYSIIHQEAVIGMFGVAPSSVPEVGLAWLLAAPALVQIKRDFIEQTPKYIEEFHQRYPILTNLVDERNALHVRWLRRCGFTFINRHAQAGVERRPFLEFVKLYV